MSGSNRNDGFEARLNRIAQERGGDTPSRPAASGVPPKRPRKTPPRSKGGGAGKAAISVIGIAGVFAAVAFGFAKGSDRGDASYDSVERKSALSGLTNLVANTPSPDSFDGLRTSGPKEHKLYDTGWVMPNSLAAAAGSSGVPLETISLEVPIGEVAAGASDGSAPPTETKDLIRFSNNDTCTLRRPQSGEVVHNVNFNNIGHYSDTHAFSKEELAKAAIDRVEGMRAHTKHYKNAAIAKGRMGQVDVFVTDTSAPVYLVLQIFDKDVIWNLHLAEGVTLAHVAMIGNKSGFAAPAGDYSFEALRIRDFVAEDDLFDNADIRRCMIAPWRPITDDWPLLGKQDDVHSASTYQGQLRTNREGYAAYAAWYRSQLGVTPDSNVVTALIAASALVGPMPQTPMPRNPVLRQQVHMAQTDYVAYSTAELDALHVELLVAAAGGDLANIRSSVMEGKIQ